LCFTDTGGTFTDCFVVDSNGDFIIGKAPTTPHDLSKGYFNAAALAAQQKGMVLRDLYSQVSFVGYSRSVSEYLLDPIFRGIKIPCLPYDR
jgi:N-methylhydantoinase A/oxoprolinase/acetone carboxylase beta subunit